MDQKNNNSTSDQALRPTPENGELMEQLADKRIFGVYKDGPGTDMAIRQLNKLGYSADDIYLYSKDEAKALQVTEGTNKDVNILSCSDGSDFIGESYHQGDIVLCVSRDPELFKKKPTHVEAPEEADTAVEVHQKVADEKKEE